MLQLIDKISALKDQLTDSPKEAQKAQGLKPAKADKTASQTMHKSSSILPNYEFIELIDSGSLGKVYKAVKKSTGEVVAVKQIKDAFRNEEVAVQLVREVQILRKLTEMGCPHITRIHDFKVSKKADRATLYIVMDYVGTNLLDVLDNSEALGFNEEMAVKILYGLLCALKFVHEANIIHRDIKPQNILIDDNLNVKLCDFGLARCLPYANKPNSMEGLNRKQVGFKLVNSREERRVRKREISPHVVSRWYRPPEVIALEKDYDQMVDIWSSGCILSELLCSTDLYNIKNSKRILFRGQFCHPLSPKRNQQDPDKFDQLHLILRILGKPDKYDKSFVSTRESYDLIKECQRDIDKIDFHNEFPDSHKDLPLIIESMLQFNPFYRKGASELLKLSVFDKIRSAKMERAPCEKLLIPVDAPGCYDYEDNCNKKFGLSDFKSMLEEEQEHVKKCHCSPNDTTAQC